MPESKPVFGYWKLRARARPIRALLDYVGQEYEYKEYDVSSMESTKEWFEKDKPALNHPLVNLPYWKEGDLILFQSNAIIRHLARNHGLAGKTPSEVATADMIAEYFAELRSAVIQLSNSTEKSLYEGKRVEHAKNWREHQLQRISKLLGSKDFLLDSGLSYVDFILHELLYVHSLLDPDLEEFTKKDISNVADFKQRFERIPKIANFMKREDARKLTIHPTFANFPGHPPS
ncbi:putative Glutathione S-transferase 2 [Hypsibius exemplaris]|uniref:glutathione transferase n=1 Tax=Hypsibius exemplaris TaxID=2072580 RepID=A0A1W0X7Y9_HYPEX|nr:putative Glutathione S-transferase 2 [Hypsibius exemplaris]